MQRIGIIGVGEIGRAIATGLHHEAADPPEVALSPRGAAAAAELADRFPGVRVCADNQEVVDRSDLVIIAVRGDQYREALAGLAIPAAKTVVNVMAGVPTEALRDLLGTDAPLIRAIPLPSIAERRSVTAVWPAHPAVDAFFAGLGGALPVPDEHAYNVLSAVTGTLTTHLSYLSALTDWITSRGIDPAPADHYIRGVYQGLARTLSDESHTLPELAANHETPRGNNERIRTTWFTPANARALHEALDGLLADLR
ncbi:Pyrroline-5-carboxylate reductase [Streptomyces sp. RB5]|uniref:Pyrroline-5-carboxylate reductase n=1 Tax=Streptomyces smaragdinus TaxID=2585196 RepID=A0A7K0CM29_9ACTN|nr:NAD(P)-binding domain-containing protein [Streptomyces smaragdinus]MQY14536.1 Pyrroline-5-carboxylate reductase [Streptomyces smaragdinus]